MDAKTLEAVVREVLKGMGGGAAPAAPASSGGKLGIQDFPLQEKRPDLIKSRTGKSMDELTLDALMSGRIGFDDFQINPQTLVYQAEIATAVNRPQMAENFDRSRELADVPDEEVLDLYDSLRPYRSSKAQLLASADHLEKTYGAVACGRLFREAADVYERRGFLNID